MFQERSCPRPDEEGSLLHYHTISASTGNFPPGTTILTQPYQCSLVPPLCALKSPLILHPHL